MRVYYLTEARWAVQDIYRKRLKISRFSELNDPFELLAADQRDRASRRPMREWAAQVNQEEGVLCFTKTWHDPLMWSHYGDRHRGVCLGFDVSDNTLVGINYEPQRLASDLWRVDVAQPPDEVRRVLLTTKFARWTYEQELRVLQRLADDTKEGQLYFKPFDHRLRLVEIIAGPRCCIEWKRYLEDAVSRLGQKPKLIKTRLSFRRFKVVTQKLQNSASRGYESDSMWQQCSCQCPKPHGLEEIRKLLSGVVRVGAFEE